MFSGIPHVFGNSGCFRKSRVFSGISDIFVNPDIFKISSRPEHRDAIPRIGIPKFGIPYTSTKYLSHSQFLWDYTFLQIILLFTLNARSPMSSHTSLSFVLSSTMLCTKHLDHTTLHSLHAYPLSQYKH